jgi:hypothetical protein
VERLERLGLRYSDELHTLSNHVLARVFDQKMNVIRGDHIIEHAKTETLLRLKQPLQIAAPIAHSEEVESYPSPYSTA